ncbi:MAG: DUF4406 domain-containing protein [Rikenellaceae bacterium]|nr:DUF4406 domain-containing protein [Rikenellaceae bacterium]
MGSKKVIYIAGRISGEPGYKEAFRQAAVELRTRGFIVLNPATLPSNLDNGRAMKICLAMIDQADALYFLPGWNLSVGAQLELAYCKYIGKPFALTMEDLEVLS